MGALVSKIEFEHKQVVKKIEAIEKNPRDCMTGIDLVIPLEGNQIKELDIKMTKIKFEQTKVL